MRPTFRKEVVGDLSFRPTEGPPTAGTVTLKDSDGAVLRADVTATTPVVATALTAPAAAGAKQVVLTTVAAVVVGQDLWVGSSADARDSLIVEEIVAATKVVKFRQPLRFNHALDAEVVSGELSVTLEAAEVASVEANCTAWWSYTVDGVVRQFEQVWDVVLRIFRLHLPEQRLKRYVSANLLEQSGQTSAELLDQAQGQIEKMLRYHGVQPEHVVDATEFERAGGLMVRVLLLGEEVQYSSHRSSVFNIARREFEDEWALVIKSAPRWLDRNADGVADAEELAVEVHREIGFPDFSGGP